MTITVEDLRTAAKVAEEKGYAGTAKLYATEAEELEKTLSERTYIDELAAIGKHAWLHKSELSTDNYSKIITEAVIEKLTEDGHLELNEPVKKSRRSELNPLRAYVDVDGDRVEYRDGSWMRLDSVDGSWYRFHTDEYAPYTLVS